MNASSQISSLELCILIKEHNLQSHLHLPLFTITSTSFISLHENERFFCFIFTDLLLNNINHSKIRWLEIITINYFIFSFLFLLSLQDKLFFFVYKKELFDGFVSLYCYLK